MGDVVLWRYTTPSGDEDGGPNYKGHYYFYLSTREIYEVPRGDFVGSFTSDFRKGDWNHNIVYWIDKLDDRSKYDVKTVQEMDKIISTINFIQS